MKTNLNKVNQFYLACAILTDLRPKGLKINNRKKVIEIIDQHNKPLLVVRATKEDIARHFEVEVLSTFGNRLIGMPYSEQLALMLKGFKACHIKQVKRGEVINLLTVNGTYFGSGSYSAKWKTNVAEKFWGEKSQKDTGFAIENFQEVPMTIGAWAWQTKSAYPGSGYKCIYIC